MSYERFQSVASGCGIAGIIVGALLCVPSESAAHSESDGSEVCHVHAPSEVPHCHFDLMVGDAEPAAHDPLRETALRSALLASRLLGLDVDLGASADEETDADDANQCRQHSDCDRGLRCVDGACQVPRLRPAKMLLDGLSMSFRIGGPGAVMQIRW